MFMKDARVPVALERLKIFLLDGVLFRQCSPKARVQSISGARDPAELRVKRHRFIASSSSRRKCDIAHPRALIHILTRAVVFSRRISPLPFLEFKAETPWRSIPSADTQTPGIHMKKIPRQGSSVMAEGHDQSLGEGQRRFMGVLDHAMDKERDGGHPLVNPWSFYLSPK